MRRIYYQPGVNIGGHFVFVKFLGHEGVAPMAAADACAKACLRMPPQPVELVVHSTLAVVVACPLRRRSSACL